MNHPRSLLAFLALSMTLSAAPTAAPANAAVEKDEYAQSTEIKDPLEKINRGTYWFNDKLYRYFFKPISQGYEKILPKVVRKSIDNAYENAKYPVRLLGSVMQGKWSLAAKQSGKFLINSTVGVAGLLTPSQRVEWTKDLPAEDMGQALAKWGIGHGPYIVLPIMGPSSGREFVGMAFDYAASPVNWLWKVEPGAQDWAWIPPAGATLASFPENLARYEDSTKNAVDEYTAVRSTFVQNRRAATER